MSFAAVLLFAPTALLLLIGGGTVVLALRAAHRRAIGPAALAVRMFAGVGPLGFAVLALSVLWSDQQYGVVILPVLALAGAAVWNAVLFGAAALAEWATRQRATPSTDSGPDPDPDRSK